MSFDGEISGNDKVNNMATMPAYNMYNKQNTKRQPLPAIPEPTGSRHLMEQIDAYTDSGSSEVVHRNVYNTITNEEPSPYEELRESKLIREPSLHSKDKANTSTSETTDGYFTIEKVADGKQESNPKEIHAVSNEYFVLEKKSESVNDTNIPKEGLQKKPTYAVVRKSKDLTDGVKVEVVGVQTTDIPEDVTKDSTKCGETIEENQNVKINLERTPSSPIGPYFTLEKVPLLGDSKQSDLSIPNGNKPNDSTQGNLKRSSDYMEPVQRKEPNVYLDILSMESVDTKL